MGAALAPHHHLDPIADLLSDRPSNSGTISQIQGPGSLDTSVNPGALVQDESCLACFHSDFVASPAVALAIAFSLQALARQAWLSPPATLTVFASNPSSRAPPVLL